MTAQSLTQCLIPLSLVERGAGNTSCDVSLLSYIQRAWNSIWHVINATSFSHSVLSDSATPRTVARQASLSFTLFQSLLRLVSIELMMSSSHLVFCCPLLLSSIFPSIRVFCNESALHIRRPKYWSFSFSISPSSEYSGFSFRTDWFDLAVWGAAVFSMTMIFFFLIGAFFSTSTPTPLQPGFCTHPTPTQVTCNE